MEANYLLIPRPPHAGFYTVPSIPKPQCKKPGGPGDEASRICKHRIIKITAIAQHRVEMKKAKFYYHITIELHF